MTKVLKIDSNDSGLTIAEELSIGVLPVTPVWVPQEPNGYPDFGGETKTVARIPINSSRQRNKGVKVGEDAAGSYSIDLTQTNSQDLMQGFMYADFLRKGEELVNAVVLDGANPDEYQVTLTAGFLVGSLIQGQNFGLLANNNVNVVTVVVVDTSVEVADGVLATEASPPAKAQIVVVGHQGATADIDVDIAGDLPALVSSVLDFTTLGLNVGETIFVGGDNSSERFTNAANNGYKRIRKIEANRLEFDKSLLTMVAETGTGLTINMYFGRVLKNQLKPFIKRRTYQIERGLGAPDDASTDEQFEYIEGANPNQADFNFVTEDKITVDLAFVGIKHTLVTAGNQKAGTRPALVDSDAFSSSSDLSGFKMAVIIPGIEAPNPLFGFFTDFKLTINNGVTIEKAIGCEVGFEATKALFAVSATVEAFFDNVSAINAIKANSDVTLDYILWRENAGISFDIPLITLGDGKAKVEVDTAIKLPLSIEAARGRSIDAALDHTLMIVFYDFLPTLADTAIC